MEAAGDTGVVPTGCYSNSGMGLFQRNVSGSGTDGQVGNRFLILLQPSAQDTFTSILRQFPPPPPISIRPCGNKVVFVAEGNDKRFCTVVFMTVPYSARLLYLQP